MVNYDKFGESREVIIEKSFANSMKTFYRSHKKIVLIVSSILGAALLVVYFWLFFQQGVLLSGRFLKQSKFGDATLYTANTGYGNLQITNTKTGERSYTVSYNLPQRDPLIYDVTFSSGIGEVEDILITSKGKTVFDGIYNSVDSFFCGVRTASLSWMTF